ncbi:MAG: hypothetical protein M3119_11110 [Verrucomicrobiota bacterium]|nr:hypothetical protein [Verrucomicrobiota bacterium]MDQ6940693.1 hypothetical protein [Verrucomicrobiota bacterium]
MRPIVSLLLLGAIFLTSCANQGVIVQKETRPHPFYESVGIENVYTFMLRDDAGVIHRQMVTPEVFERYAIGDRFNDELPTPAVNDTSEPKAVQVAMHRPTIAVGRMAQASKPATRRPVAVAKSRTSSKSKVALKSTRNGSRKIATHSSRKKTSRTKLASHSRSRKRLIAAHSKKTKTVAAATRTPKPWKITAPMAPAEGPTARVEKPALRETQVDIPDSPLR